MKRDLHLKPDYVTRAFIALPAKMPVALSTMFVQSDFTVMAEIPSHCRVQMGPIKI